MLFATGQLVYPPSTVRLHLALGRGIELTVVERDHLTYDTRWLPPRASREDARLVLHVYLEGLVEVGGALVPTPFILFERAEHYWGAGGRRPSRLRAGGARFTKIELTLEPRAVVLAPPGEPVTIDVSAEILESSRALVRSLSGRQAEPKRRAVARWADDLSRAGLLQPSVAADATSPPASGVERFWEALAPFVSTIDLGVSLRRLAQHSGVTSRQVARNIEQLLGWIGHPVGFRGFIAEWRLRLAVMLLSAPHADISAVARLVGYASSESMAAAFRDVGLAPPAEVMAAVREPVASDSRGGR